MKILSDILYRGIHILWCICDCNSWSGLLDCYWPSNSLSHWVIRTQFNEFALQCGFILTWLFKTQKTPHRSAARVYYRAIVISKSILRCTIASAILCNIMIQMATFQCTPHISRSLFLQWHLYLAVRVRYRCLSWYWSLVKVLPSKLLHCVQYRVILHRNIYRVESHMGSVYVR